MPPFQPSKAFRLTWSTTASFHKRPLKMGWIAAIVDTQGIAVKIMSIFQAEGGAPDRSGAPGGQAAALCSSARIKQRFALGLKAK